MKQRYPLPFLYIFCKKKEREPALSHPFALNEGLVQA
jgi:hypothetical protein